MDWPWFAVAVSRCVNEAFYLPATALTCLIFVFTVGIIFGCTKKKPPIEEKPKEKETGSLSLKVNKNAKDGGAAKPSDDGAKPAAPNPSKTSDDKLNHTKVMTTTESRESKLENAKTMPSHLGKQQPKVVTVAIGHKPPPRKIETEYDKVIPMPDHHEPSSQGVAADPERTVDKNGASVDGGTTNEKTKGSVVGDIDGKGCLTNGKFEKTQTEASQTQSKSKHSEEGGKNGP
uniref:Uncharacterized protein n=1 Tax=Panagrellus redivivus TaxID=6233 RepID=A0A7E4ZR99_PANRE